MAHELARHTQRGVGGSGGIWEFECNLDMVKDIDSVVKVNPEEAAEATTPTANLAATSSRQHISRQRRKRHRYSIRRSSLAADDQLGPIIRYLRDGTLPQDNQEAA